MHFNYNYHYNQKFAINKPSNEEEYFYDPTTFLENYKVCKS